MGAVARPPAGGAGGAPLCVPVVIPARWWQDVGNVSEGGALLAGRLMALGPGGETR
jgi:hypothetical protein